MVYTELHSEEDILKAMKEHWHADDNSLLPPMFHGTDYSLIDLSSGDRVVINEACVLIIESIYKLFRDRNISIYGNKTLMNVKDSYGSAQDAYIKAGGRVNNNALYEYGDFYVTNNPQRAEGYSREAWILGETGWVANLLLKGACSLGIELPSDAEFVNAYRIIDNRRNRIKNPTIIVVTDCKYSELYSEQGEQFNDDFEMNILKDDCHKGYRCSYRLGKNTLEKDAVNYVVRKELITDLIRIYYEFTV